MEKYEILLENVNFDGILAISIVEFPAIEENFMKFSKENKLILSQIDDEKRLITGPALIPDKDIVRLDNLGNPYLIWFSIETIKKISEEFLMKQKTNNVTLEHMVQVNDVSVVESWIVEDSKNDKSSKLGYNLPVGTWMISMKINNDDVWEAIKKGSVAGYSIEGYFTQRLSNFSMVEYTEEDLTEEEFVEGLTDLCKVALAIDPLEEYYIWELSMGDKICPACQEHSERGSLKLKDWLNIAIPRVATGANYEGYTTNYSTSPYGTFCEDKCRCNLVKQNTKSWTFPKK
jgi:hypothetical protein